MLQDGFWNSTGERGFRGRVTIHHGWNRRLKGLKLRKRAISGEGRYLKGNLNG
jgi:hypothetical protein